MSNTVKNSKNDSHCLAITTLSGKATIYPSVLIIDNMNIDPMIIDIVNENKEKSLEFGGEQRCISMASNC